MIKKSGLIGLAFVVFKRDRITGMLYITEPTVGRYYYQSGLGNLLLDNQTRLLVANLAGWVANHIHSVALNSENSAGKAV